MLKIRGPRVVAALVIGAALAAAGAAYQNMFRNPLVSPDILGVSAGAAVGAVLGIFLSLNVILIQSLAFAFGLAAVGLVYVTANAVRGHDPLLVLVLAGVVVGSLLGACVALMKYLADPYNQLPAITFWLLGSLASAAPADVWSALPLMLLGLLPMWLLRWRINLLSLDDEEARALGVETGRIRFVVIAAATLMTSAAVAISGVIGWIGLVIPHFARHAGRAGFFAPAADLDPAGRGVPARRGYARAHRGAHRDPAGRADGVRRHAAVPVAARDRAAELAEHGRSKAGEREQLCDFGYRGTASARRARCRSEAGEVLCLLGPNGSGKTTLFKTLLGLLPAQGGAGADGRRGPARRAGGTRSRAW